VLEGVMMRGVEHWAVAVKTPEGEVQVESFDLAPARGGPRLYRVPIIRGVAALWSSLRIGFRALAIAADAQLPADERDQRPELPTSAWVTTIVVSLVFAVGLFFVAPVTLTNAIRHQLGSSWAFWIVEGALRTAIFIGYLLLLTRVGQLRRVFEYHGAEHKTISCYEAGDELTPARAALYSRLHPRCGTSFLLVVMILAIFVFAPVGLPAWWILVLTRIVGVPLVAGIAFELIRWAGRHRGSPWVQLIIYPGMKLQLLTTREPDHDQLAVAIAALEAVLARERPGELSAEDLLGVEVVA
jgi:uncharacterized protein YqhQ